MTDLLQQAYLEFALDALGGAGRIAGKYFRKPVHVTNKAGRKHFDPVTDADREIEQFIRNRIETAYPDHGIIGEEQGWRHGSSPYRWIIDPIDGTRSFISGSPLWGILLGLLQNDECILGLMHQPYLGETYMGTLQTASYRKKNNKIKTITARNTRHLKDAILYCTHPSLFASHDDLENFMAIADKCRMMRFGGDCYIYCMLAHGFIDLVIEAGLQPYDIIPLIPIIEAAGGIITDWEGKSAAAGGRIIASATPELHAEALQLLN